MSIEIIEIPWDQRARSGPIQPSLVGAAGAHNRLCRSFVAYFLRRLHVAGPPGGQGLWRAQLPRLRQQGKQRGALMVFVQMFGRACRALARGMPGTVGLGTDRIAVGSGGYVRLKPRRADCVVPGRHVRKTASGACGVVIGSAWRCTSAQVSPSRR